MPPIGVNVSRSSAVAKLPVIATLAVLNSMELSASLSVSEGSTVVAGVSSVYVDKPPLGVTTGAWLGTSAMFLNTEVLGA